MQKHATNLQLRKNIWLYSTAYSNSFTPRGYNCLMGKGAFKQKDSIKPCMSALCSLEFRDLVWAMSNVCVEAIYQQRI